MPLRSFQSIMAWLKPGTDLKGGEADEKKLARAAAHLNQEHFSDDQRAQVLACVAEIERRISSSVASSTGPRE